MSQYNIGSVFVTNGSAVVTGISTTWLAEINVADVFSKQSSGVSYDVASVDSDTQITLSTNYAGSTESGIAYTITRDFTSIMGLPYPVTGDVDTTNIVKQAMVKIDAFGPPVANSVALAEAAAAAAAADRVIADADAISTAADKLAADADVVITNADVVATTADRVQTGLDVISANTSATNADVYRIAAEAAWSAALASNPNLNPTFRMNPRTVSQDVTIPADFNAVSVGPLFIGMGTKVTIEHGGVWRII